MLKDEIQAEAMLLIHRRAHLGTEGLKGEMLREGAEPGKHCAG